MSCVHATDRLRCNDAFHKFLVFIDQFIDALHYSIINVTDTSFIINSPSWYDFYAILPPEVRAVGFFFLFVKTVVLLSLLPSVQLDQVFTTAACGGRVPYGYRTVYHVPPFSTQYTPSFSVSSSSCQHFSRLEVYDRVSDSTVKASYISYRTAAPVFGSGSQALPP